MGRLLYLSPQQRCQSTEVDQAGQQPGQALFWLKAGFKQNRNNEFENDKCTDFSEQLTV